MRLVLLTALALATPRAVLADAPTKPTQAQKTPLPPSVDEVDHLRSAYAQAQVIIMQLEVNRLAKEHGEAVAELNRLVREREVVGKAVADKYRLGPGDGWDGDRKSPTYLKITRAPTPESPKKK